MVKLLILKDSNRLLFDSSVWSRGMLMRSLAVFFSLLTIMFFSGCPDYSHLRPVPDYENMTDSGGETEADNGVSEN